MLPKDKIKNRDGAPCNTSDRAHAAALCAEQRDEAVRWFYEQNRFDAALLSLKRTMIKYPQRYAEARYVERLFQLYHQLALHGFLLDETRRLLQVRVSEPFDVMVHRWHEVAKEQLIIQD